MEKQTKTLKQDIEHEIKITSFIPYVTIKQYGDYIHIERKHLPELIELLKSEMGGNNG
jgi:hypothetical protein